MKRSSRHPLRDAVADDAARIAEIHALGWHATYAEMIPADFLARVTPETRRPIWEQRFADGGQELRVAEWGGRIDGFVRFTMTTGSPEIPAFGELTHLYVEPSLTGGGLGQRLGGANPAMTTGTIEAALSGPPPRA